MCVHRVNISECSPETLEGIKQKEAQETLKGQNVEICKKINTQSSCKPYERKYNNTSDHYVVFTSFKEKLFNYSPYVILLLMVLVLAFCVVKVVKNLTQVRQAYLEPICYNVEFLA